MTKALQLTKAIKTAVELVINENIPAYRCFNDKRKTFQRRYKFARVFNLNIAQLTKLRELITDSNPNLKFEIFNVSIDPNNSMVNYPGYHYGLTINIL